MRRALAACFALAALSLLLPSVPTYDPWSWIVWGREVVTLDLDTTNGPSWKPLPVLLTAPFALTGAAAPALWLWAARAGGLVALVLAYRLGARLAGPVAGAVAAAGLVLVPDWLRWLAHGNVEGIVAALALGAVERHLAGRPLHALGLGYALALARPEAWPVLGLYGVVLWVREPRSRVALIGLAAALPVLWFGPDVWGAGDPLQGTSRARHMTPAEVGPLGARLLEVLGEGAGLVVAPALVAAAAALALAPAERRREVLALAGLALGWVALVAAMALVGFAGFARFMVPAAALVGVLAGAGLVWLARGGKLARAAAPGPLGSTRSGALGAAAPGPLDSARTGGHAGTGAGRLRPPRGRALGAAALAALLVAFGAARVGDLLDQARDVRARADLQRDLRTALASAGGPTALRDCRRPAVNEEVQTAVAWHLGRHLSGVNVRPLAADLAFSAPPSELAGELPRTSALGPAPRALARAGAWKVLVPAARREEIGGVAGCVHRATGIAAAPGP